MGPTLRAGRVLGVPLLLHWSLPLGLLWAGGLRFAPGAWAGYATVLLAHEAGHALLVRAQGLRVRAVRFGALGGECLHDDATPLGASVIAWGGVLAQAALYLLALSALSLFRPGDRLTAELIGVLLGPNLWLAALNLLPLPGFDGHLAWRLPSRLISSPRGRGRRGLSAAQRARLRERDVLPPADLFPGRNASRPRPPERAGEGGEGGEGGEPPPLPPELKARLDELLKR